jgi:hypothetical protein
VRDSAGVEIVENGRPAWEEDDATPWRVAEEAVLRIGVMDGDPQYAFGSVAGAVRLPDGGIAVGDAGAQEVRFFGSDGTHLRTVGGTGGGPGEFTGLAAMGPTTDGGLWLYDFPLRRVTRLDGSGDVVAVAQLPPEPAMLNAVGMLADGSLVLRQLWGARAVAGAAATGLRRDDVAYVRFGGGPLDTLALVPGREVYVADQGGRGVMMTPLFPHSSVGAVRGDRLVIGSQDRFELDEYGPDGQLVRRIRLPAPDLGVEPGDVEEYIDRYVRAVEPERRPGIRAMLESLPAPATRPAHGSLLADRLGHLWVAEWTVFGEVPDRWNVVGPEGRWLGVVELPDGFSPLDIGPDWVVGVARDELDVEYVMAYPLERGGDGNDM